MWTKTLAFTMAILLGTSLSAENSPQNEIWFKGRPTANAATQNQGIKSIKNSGSKATNTNAQRMMKRGSVADLDKGPGYEQTPTKQSSAVPANVITFLNSFTEAWNAHNSEQMAALWAVDGDLIDPWGTHAADRAAVLNLFKADQTGRFKDSVFETTVETARPIGSDLFLVDATAKVTGALNSKGEKENIDHHVVWLLRMKGDTFEAVAVRPYKLIAQNQ